MLLKSKDLREKTVEELNEELKNLRSDLFNKTMSFHARELENTAELRNLKKSIAKILTILKEKEQNA